MEYANVVRRAGEKDRPGWDANSSAPHHPIIGHTGSQTKLRNLVTLSKKYTTKAFISTRISKLI